MRSALAYQKWSSLRASGEARALGIRACQPFAMETHALRTGIPEAPTSGFSCAPHRHTGSIHQWVYMRSAPAYRKRTLLRAFGSANSAWHTRLEAFFIVNCSFFIANSFLLFPSSFFLFLLVRLIELLNHEVSFCKIMTNR
jgi:hypothetical protein